MKTNQYAYNVNGGYVKGFFNIYQARNGAIYLMMGNNSIKLSREQIIDLGIDIYSLTDFDYDNYLVAYI